MKQPINEIRRMQQLAGLITESQLNEAKIPDLIVPANDSPDLGEEAKTISNILNSADIMAKCEPGIGEIEIYLYDKSDIKSAISILQDNMYDSEINTAGNQGTLRSPSEKPTKFLIYKFGDNKRVIKAVQAEFDKAGIKGDIKVTKKGIIITVSPSDRLKADSALVDAGYNHIEL